MRKLIAVICMLPGFICAQDYTIFGQNSPNEDIDEAEHRMIVIPFHGHNFISEVDRMLTPVGMDPRQMREKIRRKCTMETTKALDDSLDVLDVSIASSGSDIDLIDYLYNAIDYGYTALPESYDSKKKLDFKFPKKKNDKALGAYSRTQNGQIDRVEINHDRYMTATFGNPGAVDFLQDIHAFEYILSITQLEIRRNLQE
ncbi:MAG: hypothetical protein HKO93_04795, partial [Flavobacteriales bacterium]|nr:hypothetical protein [Flavobacteriales bacterium]